MIAAELSVTAKQLFGLILYILQSTQKVTRLNVTMKMDFHFKFYFNTIF